MFLLNYNYIMNYIELNYRLTLLFCGCDFFPHFKQLSDFVALETVSEGVMTSFSVTHFFNQMCHSKCIYNNIYRDQPNKHRDPLAAIDLHLLLYLTNGIGVVT